MMAKYIDSDALKNNLISHGAICDFGQYLIDIQPAADVRPERHGGWQHNGNGGAVCTCCKGVSDEPFAIYYDYCPNCGAMMDGKEHSNG